MKKSKDCSPHWLPALLFPPPRRLADPDRVRKAQPTPAPAGNRDFIWDCRNAARAGAGWLATKSALRGRSMARKPTSA